MKVRPLHALAGLVAASLLTGLVLASGGAGGEDAGMSAVDAGSAEAGYGGAGGDGMLVRNADAPEAAREMAAQVGMADESGDASTATGSAAARSRQRGSGDIDGVGTERVIKTATIHLGVPEGKFDEAAREGRTVARQYSGFIVSSFSEGRRAKHGTFVMRVPARSFEAALNDLEALGKVRSEEIRGEDVGEEFVDLESRLRNFTAQEAVLLRLMDEANSVSDSIKVQRELTHVQLEVERLRGRLRFLDDQTSFSTIAVSITEDGASSPGVSVIGRAWGRAVDAFLSVVAAVIVGAGFLLPLLAMLVAAIVLGRKMLARPAA